MFTDLSIDCFSSIDLKRYSANLFMFYFGNQNKTGCELPDPVIGNSVGSGNLLVCLKDKKSLDDGTFSTTEFR